MMQYNIQPSKFTLQIKKKKSLRTFERIVFLANHKIARPSPNNSRTREQECSKYYMCHLTVSVAFWLLLKKTKSTGGILKLPSTFNHTYLISIQVLNKKMIKEEMLYILKRENVEILSQHTNARSIKKPPLGLILTMILTFY